MELVARTVIAVTFAVSVVLKARDRHRFNDFAASLADWGIPGRRRQSTAAVGALILESAVAVAAVALPRHGQIPGAVLLAAMTAGLVRLRLHGIRKCHCFGSTSSGPMTEHIVINAIFVALSLVALGGYWPASGVSVALLQGGVGVGIALCQFVPGVAQRVITQST